MSGIVKGALGFVGAVVVAILVGLAWMVLDALGLRELAWVLIVAGIIAVVAVGWFIKYRRDQKWIKENQDLITGNRRRSRQANAEAPESNE